MEPTDARKEGPTKHNKLRAALALNALYTSLSDRQHAKLIEQYVDPLKDALVKEGWFNEDLEVK